MNFLKTKFCHSIFAIALSSVCVFACAGGTHDPVKISDPFERDADDPYLKAMQAFIWGYPIVRAAELRLITTQPGTPDTVRPPDVPGAAINRIGHQRQLSTPNTRLGVAPNHDTLYSLAWLDLDVGPFVLETPDFGDRYYVFQMGQADSSTVESFGQRNYGGKLPPIFVYGPSFQGTVPDGMLGVESLYRYLMIAGRIFVTGDSDIQAVHKLQDKIKLKTFSAYSNSSKDGSTIVSEQDQFNFVTKAREEFNFLEKLGIVLKSWDTQPEEESLVKSFKKIALTKKDGFELEALGEHERELVAQGVSDGMKLVREKTLSLGHMVNGWSVNYKGADFGSDYLLRAAVAMDQIYILGKEDALYPSARVDKSGRTLDGRKECRIHFSAGELPPVDRFWSITLYYAEGFMVENEIDRWSISDRTSDLRFARDGSLDIIIQHQKPQKHMVANWLPAPNEPYMLLMRLYEPSRKIQDQEWYPPPIECENSD